MVHICPSCHQSIPLDTMNIIDEQIVHCPHCSNHFKIYLDPKVKQILESSNQEIMKYLMAYPHLYPEQEVIKEMPSGVISTNE